MIQHMDAKTFLSNKHNAAIEELKALEAEYQQKKLAAQATVDLTKKWLDEMGLDFGKPTPAPVENELPKKPSENWVSARDLTARVSPMGSN
jgi:hypothetical protein